jgi:membrane peptidoglycan carboxypeptidase
VRNLTVAESAFLAGIIACTDRCDPARGPEAKTLALARMNLVLVGMVELKALSPEARSEIDTLPVTVEPPATS